MRKLLVAEVLDNPNGGVEHVAVRTPIDHVDVLGPEACDAICATGTVDHCRRHQVHRGRADEAGNEHVRWVRIEILGTSNLLEHAGVHYGDAVAHCHRFHLVVCDVDGRRAQVFLQFENLGARLNPELRIEVRQWLVHQEGSRLADDGAAQRHALPLPA